MPRSDTHDSLRRARELIDDQYARPLDLDELARTANFSRYYFLRAFRRALFPADLIPHVQVLLDKNAMNGGVWEADDCQKTYEDLKARGIEFLKPPTKEFYGIEALFKDGCGNWFSLTEHPKD